MYPSQACVQRFYILALASLMALAPTVPSSAQETQPAARTGESETIKAVGDAYPLSYCIICDKKIDSKGEPVSVDHNGRDIKFCCPGCAALFRKEPAGYLAQMDTKMVEQQLPVYPLDTCLVSGQKLGSMGEPVDKVYNNRLVRFCCAGCVPGFEKDPATYIEKLDAAVVEAQLPDYPMETCVVSGHELGSMGDPVNYVNANRLVRFCCAGCTAAFEKHPAKFHATLDEAYVKQQVKTYPLKTCVVSGEELGSMGKPIEYLHGNKLVRFCCEGCVAPFEKDPQKYLDKLEARESGQRNTLPRTGHEGSHGDDDGHHH